jgi:hypothetical protein
MVKLLKCNGRLFMDRSTVSQHTGGVYIRKLTQHLFFLFRHLFNSPENEYRAPCSYECILTPEETDQQWTTSARAGRMVGGSLVRSSHILCNRIKLEPLDAATGAR